MIPLKALGEKHGGIEKVPRAELPKMNNLGVLIRCERFSTVAEIPAIGEFRKEIFGLVVAPASFRVSDRDAVLSDFPGIDLEKTQVLAGNKAPPGLWERIAGFLLGVALLFASLWLVMPNFHLISSSGKN